MILAEKQKVFDLVKKICDSTVGYDAENNRYIERKNAPEDYISDVPTDKTVGFAYEILKTLGVTESAKIQEIPLCWKNQVCIRFCIGEWSPETNGIIFDLSAGMSYKDNTLFFLQLQVENDFQTFPVPSDDDVGIFLIQDSWKVAGNKIVE